MTREDIENNVGYWQEKANLEYIRQRQEHGVNDPYMITEIDEAFAAGFDKGYQYAVDKACEWLRENIYHRVYECGDRLGYPTADFLKDFRKAMED